MSDKILGYRIFSDDDGRMNRNIIDEKLDLLIVPQFTLAANTKSGTRPSFSCAANPQIGRDLFIQFLEIIKSKYRNIESGKFKENMDVSLINDGPVTFWLEVN
jgi:D-tyrosyl-tRNA(Tyr) deacylase